ncbi:unnamed protein product [Auanema sp. JU1783]|nr:unnamed protein product [Auanema sp. JU1783]
MSDIPQATLRTQPVIFVIGCTGTGKSDLAVAIAKKYGGEVISADSMQIYQGLDIATNKITDDEMQGVPHHLMSFVNPCTSNFNVQQFREMGLQAIKEIQERGNIPVIAGGTTYYVESLLFQDNFIPTQVPPDHNEDLKVLGKLSNTTLYSLLKEVSYRVLPLFDELVVQIDPKSAESLHPNNRARVLRAIEIFKLTGKRKSEHLDDQKKAEGVKVRYDDTLVISLDAALGVLDERLNKRVEKMKYNGLKQEICLFYENNKKHLDTMDYGIMQCIGLKEFIPFLKLETRQRNSKVGDSLLEQGCEEVKLHTRQYSRKQRSWVRSRLISRQSNNKESFSFTWLDTSDKDTFIEGGLKHVERWMNGEDFNETNDKETESVDDSNMTIHCAECDILISGKNNWEKHVGGKKHKARLRLIQKNRDGQNLKRPLEETSDDCEIASKRTKEFVSD